MGREDIANIYIPEEFKSQWKKFVEICKRDNSSAGEKIRDYVATFVRLHDPGNPQQLIVTFLKGEKAYVAPKCFVCGAGATCFVVNLQNQKRYPACQQHEKAALESGKWTKADKGRFIADDFQE